MGAVEYMKKSLPSNHMPQFLVPSKTAASTCIVGMYIESQLYRGEETVSSRVVEY
jgi:hypothetical protein